MYQKRTKSGCEAGSQFCLNCLVLSIAVSWMCVLGQYNILGSCNLPGCCIRWCVCNNSSYVPGIWLDLHTCKSNLFVVILCSPSQTRCYKLHSLLLIYSPQGADCDVWDPENPWWLIWAALVERSLPNHI